MKNVNVLSAKALKSVLAGTVLAGLLTVPGLSFAANSLPLNDIDQTVNKNAILKLNYAGVLKGYTDGSFKPAKEVTRAEFAKIAVMAMGYTEEQVKLYNGTTAFKDIPADHWASGYINLAVDKGIIKGYPDHTFRANNQVKVSEALTVLVNGLKINVTASSSLWYQPYLLEANKVGIYDTTETATANATREMIAKFADKFMETPVYASGAYYDTEGNHAGTKKKLAVEKGIIASYDKTTGKLTFAGDTKEFELAGDAQQYGNLVTGAEMEYILKNGKIAFAVIATSDSKIVQGIVKTGLNATAAVGDENIFTATVNGKESELTVNAGVSVKKSDIGQKFVAIVDENGKVTSITFSANEATGVAEKITVVSGTNGKRELKVNGTSYQLTTDAKVTGKKHPLAAEEVAAFADIAKGDLVTVTLDVNGKASLVSFTKLTATAAIQIDEEQNEIEVDGKKYDVTKDTALLVNDKEVAELDQLKDDTVAVLTFSQAGDLVKVEQGTKAATGLLVSDTTAFTAGTPAVPATITVGGKVYDVLLNATVTIDGTKVAATSITADQLNDYKITSWKTVIGTNDVQELTAEKQTVTGYVTEQTAKTVTVNDKTYTLAAGVTIDEDASTNAKEYTLVLTFDGKVKAISSAERTISGVINAVHVVNEDGATTEATVVVDGKTYQVLEADTLKDLERFEYATLQLDRDDQVIGASATGEKAFSAQAFKGLESRVNGDQYVFFNDTETNVKLAKNAQFMDEEGSAVDADDLQENDVIDIYTNDADQAYLIVVKAAE
ncbi:S-layer homology domain-containing protein [Brevibacillus migulae]|uniref:S-layer homology domain-containing protein n=1 Tax=Brevibacillus migulae TaxID=1644114 RepID=UPI00106E9AAF|nr:S-layer homology domain-containing protein [Brevibacillus migulae]